MKSIKNHLQDFGFNTELSWSTSCIRKKEGNFRKTLQQYLGPSRYKEYLKIQESFDELSIMKFIGEDEALFRLLLSCQIEISEEIFQEILNTVKQIRIQPKRILELGGANGWACDYLMNYVFDQVDEAVVVDSFQNWKAVNQDIKILADDYFAFQSEKKFDFIFSILGYSTEDYSYFLKKAISLLDDNGFMFLGLRIPSEKKYEDALTAIYESGCILDQKFSKRVKVGNEQFPMLVIRKGENLLSNNEKLIVIRKCFHNLHNPKRIVGFEAKILLESLGKWNLIFEERKEWEDGTWLTMSYRDYHGVIFRVTGNFANDSVVEFPISEQIDIEEFSELIQFQRDYFSSNV